MKIDMGKTEIIMIDGKPSFEIEVRAASPSTLATRSSMTLEEETILRAELAQLRELKFCEPSEIDLPTDAQIRATFLANGFTIKEGQADLKPYVFEAAHALIDLMRGGPLALLTEQGDPANPKDDSDRSFDRPIGYLSADSLSRLNSGHDATLRSAKFGPSYLDCDVPIYLDQKISPSTIPMTDDKILEIAKSSCVASNRFGITLVLNLK